MSRVNFFVIPLPHPLPSWDLFLSQLLACFLFSVFDPVGSFPLTCPGPSGAPPDERLFVLVVAGQGPFDGVPSFF